MGGDKKFISEVERGGLSNKDLVGLAGRLRESAPVVEEEAEVEFDTTEQEDSGAKFPKFTEKKIRNMIRAPFELSYILTGDKDVRITDDEINLILEDTVDVMNELVKVNPLWLAGCGILVNGGAITMSKINKYRANKAKPIREKYKCGCNVENATMERCLLHDEKKQQP